MTTDLIRIRSYNVGFGDCFLVSIADGPGAKKKHMLIDFGNAPGKGGSNKNFRAIAEDIRDETDGHLDVIVMTHEHLDHMEGFRSQKAIFDEMTVDWVWMSLPSEPGYYDKFPAAQPQKKLRAMASDYYRSLTNRNVSLAPSFEALLLNNLSNVDRIDYLRTLATNDPVYLHRGRSVRNKPFSSEVKITILGPEKDMSVYYGSGHAQHFSAMANSVKAACSADAAAKQWWDFPGVKRVKAPPNLSTRDWRSLEKSIKGGAVSAIRSIDKAANNTSLVFLIEAHGKRLLFTGDAELESWEVIEKEASAHLDAVDFLKVSHHGSHNGTPLALLDRLLPKSRKDNATVLVSTKSKVYGTKNPVPDEALLEDLMQRCGTLATTDQSTELWVDVHL